MKLGFVSDSLGGMSFTEMLDHAARMGVSGVEVNTCGWSTAPHFDLKRMLGNADAQRAFQKAFADRGLDIISLNANGNPLHPTDPKQGNDLRDTIRVAGEMGITTVCTMSGLPAGSAADLMPNWVVSSWPPETQDILRYQWQEKLIPFWEEIVALAKSCGVGRVNRFLVSARRARPYVSGHWRSRSRNVAACLAGCRRPAASPDSRGPSRHSGASCLRRSAIAQPMGHPATFPPGCRARRQR